MGTRGPAPQSRHLQVLKSGRRNARQNGRPLSNQPQPVPAIPPKPDDLGEHGSWLWDLVTPELERMRLLAQVDRTEVETYCALYDVWKRTDPRDRRWLSMVERMSRLACNLGCSPGARLRMDLPEPPAEEESAVFDGG